MDKLIILKNTDLILEMIDKADGDRDHKIQSNLNSNQTRLIYDHLKEMKELVWMYSELDK